MPRHLLDEIKVLANKKDVPYQSLMKVMLDKALREEKKTGKGENITYFTTNPHKNIRHTLNEKLETCETLVYNMPSTTAGPLAYR